jgi:hypothetical protein
VPGLFESFPRIPQADDSMHIQHYHIKVVQSLQNSETLRNLHCLHALFR